MKLLFFKFYRCFW